MGLFVQLHTTYLQDRHPTVSLNTSNLIEHCLSWVHLPETKTSYFAKYCLNYYNKIKDICQESGIQQ